MDKPFDAALWARPPRADDEPLTALQHEDRVMMAALRLIAAAGLAIALLGAALQLAIG